MGARLAIGGDAQCPSHEQDLLFFSSCADLGPYTDGVPGGLHTWESISYLHPGTQVYQAGEKSWHILPYFSLLFLGGRSPWLSNFAGLGKEEMK